MNININAAPQESGKEHIAELLLNSLFIRIGTVEGKDSIISGIQDDIITCINTIRHELGKAPLEMGALEAVHLKTGEGNSVYEPEFDAVIGTLDSIGKGGNQVFTLTDPEALKRSILAKVEK